MSIEFSLNIYNWKLYRKESQIFGQKNKKTANSLDTIEEKTI